MRLEKLNPWNWFKHEESSGSMTHSVPVRRDSGGQALSREQAGGVLPGWPWPQVDNLFQDLLSQMGGPLLSQADEQWFRPSLDLSSDEKHYRITLEAPGMSEDDLSIEVDGDRLIIKGEKQQEFSPDEDRQYYRVERRYGAFQRVLSLPTDADSDGIEAELRKGVLTLMIPRREGGDTNVKRVSIQRS